MKIYVSLTTLFQSFLLSSRLCYTDDSCLSSSIYLFYVQAHFQLTGASDYFPGPGPVCPDYHPHASPHRGNLPASACNCWDAGIKWVSHVPLKQYFIPLLCCLHSGKSVKTRLSLSCNRSFHCYLLSFFPCFSCWIFVGVSMWRVCASEPALFFG